MIDVRDISPEAAARALAGLARMDARGLMTEADVLPMCQYGKCVRVSSEKGAAVLCLVESNGTLWVDAAKAEGPSDRLTDVLDDLLVTSGARRIAFMTKREGLKARALARGYRVAGYVLEKEI